MNETVDNTRTSPGFTLVLFSIVAIMVLYTEAMIIPALPAIEAQYHITAAWAAWILSIYLVVAAVTVPIFGKLGDSYGKKKLLLVALTLYTIAVIGNGFAWNLPSLLVFRAIQGVGLGIFPLEFAIIRDEFPPERVVMATGIVSAMYGAGAAVGLVVGAWISSNYGWQTTYHTVVPAAIVLTLLAGYKLKESPIRTPSRVDVLGATTFAIAIVSFLVAITEGQTWGWTSQATLGLLGISLAFIIIFVVIESRIIDPMISLAMMSKRDVFFTNIIGFIAGLCYFMVFQTIVYLMQLPQPVGFASTLFQAGLIIAPGAILLLIAAPFVGVIVKRRGEKLPLVIGTVLLAASFYCLYAFHATQLQIIFGVLIAGVGVSFDLVTTANIIVQSVEQSQTGTATGMMTIFRTVGSAVGPVITGVYLTQYVSPLIIQTPRGPVMGPLLPNGTAFDYIFLTALGISIIGVLVALLIKGGSGEVQKQEQAENVTQ
jgi:EmrB/QacA subfamily drug resistance transporter